MTATQPAEAAAPGAPSAGRPPHIELRRISKSYGGVQVVSEVSFAIEPGSVHALVGENGAGKSTVSKMLAGVTGVSSGELLLHGTPTTFSSPRRALADGIAMIDQELAMAQQRSVIDNVFLGYEPRRLGLLDRRAQRARYRELLDQTGFDLAPDARVGSLRIADQQKVEILRAVARRSSFIIMDEPTAPLTEAEAEQLYAIIRSLAKGGTTVLYISHFLEEVLALADTVTVMRDGRHITTDPSRAHTPDTLVTAMLGRSMELAFPDRVPAPPDREPVLEARSLSAPGRFEAVSLALRPGEIVGLAGLVGSGRSEVARALSGADPDVQGELLIDGQSVSFHSPRAAIEAGVVMLPESRKDDGLVMSRSIAENLMLAELGDVSSRGMLRPRLEKSAVDALIDMLDIRAADQGTPVGSLSGGNQQKVLFGKCLNAHPRVLLVDEPTRGVDVGAKKAIYDLLIRLAQEGLAILLISSELEEVLGLAHRVLVMRRGRLVRELAGEQADERRVLAAAFGTEVDSDGSAAGAAAHN